MYTPAQRYIPILIGAALAVAIKYMHMIIRSSLVALYSSVRCVGAGSSMNHNHATSIDSTVVSGGNSRGALCLLAWDTPLEVRWRSFLRSELTVDIRFISPQIFCYPRLRLTYIPERSLLLKCSLSAGSPLHCRHFVSTGTFVY